ncbi:MAG: Secretion system C-terminal sorting domain [Bacteroidota bacterium]|jgi:hypothetical protein|nr:Secretion system C-terminal sorting domain [Bacteroidota bacterium]
MKLIVFFWLLATSCCFSQQLFKSTFTFKGEHYALYNKCKAAVTFCELTQQEYTSCGSVKNCYGLYVLPGDTFFITIEDKTQTQTISADISFGGYFPAISSFTFEPIDMNCMPQQALQIAIPLLATQGSSFEITAQNTAFVSNPALDAGVPQPFTIFIGGQQPDFTFALSDYSACPVMEDVSVKENSMEASTVLFFPNPSSGIVYFNTEFASPLKVNILDALGQIVLENTLHKHSLDLMSLKNGIYFCRIFEDTKPPKLQRIIIQK